MAQPIRVVTAKSLSIAMAEAGPLCMLDASLLESVLTYVETNDLDGAHTYAATISQEGLARALRNLTTASTVVAVALVKKQILREDSREDQSKEKEGEREE